MPDIFRNTGPRRLCPDCQRNVSTDRGRFTVHYISAGKPCPGSDKLVPKPAANLPTVQPNL